MCLETDEIFWLAAGAGDRGACRGVGLCGGGRAAAAAGREYLAERHGLALGRRSYYEEPKNSAAASARQGAQRLWQAITEGANP